MDLPTPEPGTILHPGDHLVELEFWRPIRAANADEAEAKLRSCLTRMGFEKHTLDHSLRVTAKKRPSRAKAGAASPPSTPTPQADAHEWGDPERADSIDPNAPIRYRFIGRLASAIRTINTPAVRWIYTAQLPERAHVFEDPVFGVRERKDHELIEGQLYCLYLIAWTMTHKERTDVSDELAKYGFAPQKILCVSDDNKYIPDKPGASNAYWVAIGRWTQGKSYTSPDDPFWFERVVPMGE